MPKMKNKSAAAKRFSVRASGKIKRFKANKGHILTKKSRNRKNRLKKSALICLADRPLVLACLPNR